MDDTIVRLHRYTRKLFATQCARAVYSNDACIDKVMSIIRLFSFLFLNDLKKMFLRLNLPSFIPEKSLNLKSYLSS